MKSIATIKIKIPKKEFLAEIIKEYSKCIQYISNKGFNSKTYNRYKLHNLVYYDCRKKFNLPSQFIINTIRVASQTLKSTKTNKGSKPIFKEFMPIDFDKRTFTFSFDKVRISTLNKRKDIPINIPEYYWKYLDWNYQTMQVRIDKLNSMFLHITFSRDIAIPQSSDELLGIDVGINNIAVTSNKMFFNSKHTKYIKSKYRYLRSRLQSKGTRSSRKLLKKISGKEKRFMRQCNHEISKTIVNACNIGDTIVMEDIKGIRGCKVSRKQRYWLNSWSFYQLRQFIEYKARLNGNRVILVNPRNTSKRCSKCGSLNTIRQSSNFHCLDCSYHINADLNASFNLKFLGKFLITKADVNQLHIPNVDSKAIFNVNEIADDFRDNQYPKSVMPLASA